jgi:hypothetical protein
VVEDRGLGRPRSARVVVHRDRVEQLGPCVDVECSGALLDEAQREVNMPEELPLRCRRERGSRRELSRPAGIVQQRRGEEQVRAQARMKLCELAGDRRNAHRVLEQTPCVSVMTVRCCRQEAEEPAHVGVDDPLDGRAEAGMRDLGGQEVEEALELVGVAPDRRDQRQRVELGRRLQRADVDLEAVAEPLDPAEHANGVALGKAGVEELDVVPHARLDPAARVDELEREVRCAAARAQPALARHCVRPLDDTLLRQLGDDAHASSLGPATDARFRAMAEIRPFAALRYDEAEAGPLASLVAPPYDVISPDERLQYLGRSPYNVVHLTLPDAEEQAAADLAAWRDAGVLARDEPACWALAQTYVGPDGIERTRNGYVVSLRIEPYERRVVLPHERTHAAPKEGRLRLLRATRTQLEPIFLLHDGAPATIPSRAPDLEAGGDRLWRVDGVPDVAELQLLIADGHHRYETALTFHDEDGGEGSAWMMVVLVSTREEGLTIFPTHRLAQDVDGVRGTPIDEPADDLPGVVLYRAGRYELLEGEGLDVELVERAAPQGVSYTPSRDRAVEAVDRGEAQAAFLLRPTKIDDVFAVARRGDVMPQKSTYFFPKLTSGLLFHPLD